MVNIYIKKKISIFEDKEFLRCLPFPKLDLAELNAKLEDINGYPENLTIICKSFHYAKILNNSGNFITSNPIIKEKFDFKTKFYILNHINNQGENQSSGGVEAFNNEIDSGNQPLI